MATKKKGCIGCAYYASGDDCCDYFLITRRLRRAPVGEKGGCIRYFKGKLPDIRNHKWDEYPCSRKVEKLKRSEG